MPSRALRGRRCRQFPAPAARFLIAAALLAGPYLMGAPQAQPGPKSFATRTVMIQNLQFSPQTLTVHRGDHIVWVNKDLFPHTVTAAAKEFDSQSIAANASWTYVAKKSGTFPYSCTFHSTMKGTLVVQ
ncbi:MAG TPA: cupredoxin family copper-binding protein [Steroidobacteraceae bacterium]|jgi:plastocyanin